LINPSIRGARRRRAITETARQIADAQPASAELDPTEAHLVSQIS
jgi:hypothetical protein